MPLSTHDWGMIAAGGAFVIVLGMIAHQQSGEVIVPEVQTEAQFSGLGLDLGGQLNLGTNLSLDRLLHFYHPGYDPWPGGQKLVTLPHRYPHVSGGNISTVIHRGMSAMCKGSPDNAWRIFPPSEEDL